MRMRTIQVLARLVQTGTAASVCGLKSQELGLAAHTSAPGLWRDTAQQQRCFGGLISAATAPSQRDTAAVGSSAQLSRASWHGLHGLPPAAASNEDPGHRCEEHDHHDHHSHQPSAEAKHPVAATAGQLKSANTRAALRIWDSALRSP